MALTERVVVRIDGKYVARDEPVAPKPRELPRAQVRVTEDIYAEGDDPRQLAEVVVDGKPVAQLPLTTWHYEGNPGGLPKLTITLHSEGAAIDSLMPKPRPA